MGSIIHFYEQCRVIFTLNSKIKILLHRNAQDVNRASCFFLNQNQV